MGCPDKKVLKQGAGAALINNPALAQEIIRQTKERGGQSLPVSIKTRIGYDKYDKRNLKMADGVAGRKNRPPSPFTGGQKEMSLVPAHWDIIAEAVKIRNKFDNSKDRTLILGNGDVKSVTDAEEKAKETGADGVMIGRAVFGNPWLFAEKRPCQEPAKPVTMFRSIFCSS